MTYGQTIVSSLSYLPKGETVWTGRAVYPEARHERIGEQEVDAISLLPTVMTKMAYLKTILNS